MDSCSIFSFDPQVDRVDVWPLDSCSIFSFDPQVGRVDVWPLDSCSIFSFDPQVGRVDVWPSGRGREFQLQGEISLVVDSLVCGISKVRVSAEERRVLEGV